MAKRGRPKGSKNKIKVNVIDFNTKTITFGISEVPKQRGRPKGSKNKVIKTSTECDLDIPKKKRGRPKRSFPRKNPIAVKDTKKVASKSNPVESSNAPKKRGRPKKYTRNVEEIDISNVVISKFLGYCLECTGMVSFLDLEEGKKTIYKCALCDHRGRISELKDTRNGESRPKSKKEYLARTTDVSNYGFVSTYEDDIPTELEDVAIVPKPDEWN